MNPAPHPLTAIFRGACRRCPNCGRGALFHRYLKQVLSCAECREDFAHIRADDGPAWLTIVVIGHIVVGLALMAEVEMAPPVWLSAVVFSALALLMTLFFLPRAKGAFIGAIWSLKATGE